MSELRKGIVKWFDNRRGFGFIKQQTGLDIFVHYTVIEAKGFRKLEDGEIVYYVRKDGPKGPCAERVLRTGIVMENLKDAMLQHDDLLERLEGLNAEGLEGSPAPTLTQAHAGA